MTTPDEAPPLQESRADDAVSDVLALPFASILAPGFQSLPPQGPAPVASSDAVERAQVMAMAERLMHSVHIGRIAGGHQVHLRLAGDVEVRLRHQDGVLQATVVGEGDQGALARRLGAELRARGIRFDRVELG